MDFETCYEQAIRKSQEEHDARIQARKRREERRRKTLARRKMVFAMKVTAALVAVALIYVGFLFVGGAVVKEADASPVETVQYPVTVLQPMESGNDAEEELEGQLDAVATSYAALPASDVSPCGNVPDVKGTDFKTFMDYRTITAPSSIQYAMQQEAQTNELGIRTWNGYPMVAVGTYFADKCGYLVTVVLEGGHAFDAVVGDIKADIHTDESHRVTLYGNAVEFIVDGDHIPDICWQTGDMSYASEQYSGRVLHIETKDLLFTR